MILVTGGAGFIGSNFILDWLSHADTSVIALDKLTYAGNLGNLAALTSDPRFTFVQGDIGDTGLVSQLLSTHQIHAVVHFAAESHVDRSIHGAEDFIQTNIQSYYRPTYIKYFYKFPTNLNGKILKKELIKKFK